MNDKFLEIIFLLTFFFLNFSHLNHTNYPFYKINKNKTILKLLININNLTYINITQINFYFINNIINIFSNLYI